MEDEELKTVPVPRPGLLEEYQTYMNAVDDHNRKAMASACGSPQWHIDEMYSPLRQAPRCEHVRAEGLRCQAPALRGRKLCYAHTRMLAAAKAGLQLPPLEDASGIALAAMQVVQQMLDGKLDRKTAAVALYGIQIVAGTLKHKLFSPKPTSVVVEASGLPPEEELLAWSNLVSSSAPAANAVPVTAPVKVQRPDDVVNGKIHRGDAESQGSAESPGDAESKKGAEKCVERPPAPSPEQNHATTAAYATHRNGDHPIIGRPDSRHVSVPPW